MTVLLNNELGEVFLDIKYILRKIIELLNNKYNLNCDLSIDELMDYLNADTYEDEKISIGEILNNELLLLHEVAEICFLKSMGYGIDEHVVINAYPDTYKAHLEALEIELSEAFSKRLTKHIANRCRDLLSYLDDPYLPEGLENRVEYLINKYCRGARI